MKWQPIETAPIAKVVLVWGNGMDEPELGYVWGRSLITEAHAEQGSAYTNLTHWMPLPKSPDSITTQQHIVEMLEWSISFILAAESLAHDDPGQTARFCNRAYETVATALSAVRGEAVA